MIRRILIANRGEIARRLVRTLKALDIESVTVFSEPEVEQPWVDEADYAVYLNGATLADTYMNGRKLVSSALDAAADAIHPGYCFLAERPDFFAMARAANLHVIGADEEVLNRTNNWAEVHKAAAKHGIPLIPSTAPLADDDDGIEQAARLGLPLFVKAVAGGVLRRVDQYADLADALTFVRQTAGLVTGKSAVYLERYVETMSHCGITVVADRHGSVSAIGRTDGSLQVGYRSWIEELGPTVAGAAADERLREASTRLARELGWVGIGRVRWALTPHGGWHLLGFSARLTTGYDLIEHVFEIDLVTTQLRIHLGDSLSWQEADYQPRKHAMQLRVFHVDPQDGRSRPEGVLERLVVPEGVEVAVGVGEGQRCTRETEPLVAKITVVGESRQAVIVRARAALEHLVVEGISTNREVLLGVLGERAVWDNAYDVHTLPRFLAGRES